MVALFRAGQSRPAQNRVMPGQSATVYLQYIEKYGFFSQRAGSPLAAGGRA
jgi:hypothetical protein